MKFKSEIWNACSNDAIRPVLNLLYFSEEMGLCATEGHIVVCQSFDFLSMTEEEKAIATGKYLSTPILKKLKSILFKDSTICEIKENGLNVSFITKGTLNKIIIPFYNEDGTLKYPDVASAFNITKEREDTPEFGIDVKFFDLLSKSLYFDYCKSVKMKVKTSRTGIRVDVFGVDYVDQKALIMPVAISH